MAVETIDLDFEHAPFGVAETKPLRWLLKPTGSVPSTSTGPVAETKPLRWLLKQPGEDDAPAGLEVAETKPLRWLLKQREHLPEHEAGEVAETKPLRWLLKPICSQCVSTCGGSQKPSLCDGC